MSAQLIDGVLLSQQLRAEIAQRASALTARGKQPGLAVILVGEDPASQIYVRNKGEQTAAAGMRSDTHKLPDTTTTAELLDLIWALPEAKPVRDLAEELDPELFWQIHRATLVNVNAIEGVTRDIRGRHLVLIKGKSDKLEVSRSFLHLFKQM